jgi:hypothetical protein
MQWMAQSALLWQGALANPPQLPLGWLQCPETQDASEVQVSPVRLWRRQTRPVPLWPQ